MPGSPEALRSLLQYTPTQIKSPSSISRFDPFEPITTEICDRALRTISVARAELVGPSQWSLRDDSPPVREDATLALNHFFRAG